METTDEHITIYRGNIRGFYEKRYEQRRPADLTPLEHGERSTYPMSSKPCPLPQTAKHLQLPQ